ncbi:MAG TPA: aldehyde reductase [Candidatus Cybelea sp.]|jgi:nucleoside-diphosphate-sugar epimerase
MASALVTGGSGAITRWCIVELLRRGYDVRTTLRDLAREAEVRSSIATQVDPQTRLTFHVADLTRDDGWAQAVAGAQYVLHLASPFPPGPPKHEDDLIVPARDGTLRVLRASVAAGIERVVVTSSAAAIGYGPTPAGGMYTEKNWSDPTSPQTPAYARSKTIAERAAWDFMKTSAGTMTLAVVNPTLVVGPVLGEDHSYSYLSISRLLAGDMPMIPRLGFNFVDVRDIAELHILAMTTPNAAGQRFIGTGTFAWLADVSRILRERLGPDARKVPTRIAPDVLVRFLALFQPSLRGVVADLGDRTNYSSTKARTELGWQPRQLHDTVVDCARSLIANGIVKV